MAAKRVTFRQIRQVLTDRRLRMHWSQGDLGERLNISPQMVSYLETRQGSKSWRTLVRWARALGVDVEIRLLASDGRTLFVGTMVAGEEEEGEG